MSSDYAEKEREFLDTLEADTGRNLTGWMTAITGTGLTHRDDIIDWLRRHRFTFDRASWLERIHNNGGRPIYAEMSDSKTLTTDVPGALSRTHRAAFDSPEPPGAALASTRPMTPQPLRAALPPSGAETVETLLAKGKAFRPLAQHLLKAIETAHPGLVVTTRGALVALGLPDEFAVLAVSAKDVKLGLAMGDAMPREGLDVARIPNAGPSITHMAALTDVRRVDAALLRYLAEAAARATASGGHGRA